MKFFKGRQVRLTKTFVNGRKRQFRKGRRGVVDHLEGRHLVAVKLRGVDHVLFVPREGWMEAA